MMDDSTPRSVINYSIEDAASVAALFDISRPVKAYDFPDKGNIHQHTFLVHAGRKKREYLLQRINQEVFTRPHNTMRAMAASINSQNRSLAGTSEDWIPITLIPTRSAKPYLVHNDHHGTTYWRLMIRIPGCHTFKALSEVMDRRARLEIAGEAGRGLALYLRFTSVMDISGLASPLPGYRDTRLYYNQLLSVLQGCRTVEDAASFLPECPETRHSTERHFLVHLPEAGYRKRMEDSQIRRFIRLARANREFAMTLLREMEAGRIRTVAIHGDTKLDNFLFCSRTHRVKAMVDLDTIMPHTWLADWGDMVRSLVNVAGEKEPDLSRVKVDEGIFEAVARGFIGAFGEIPTAEQDLMVDAVRIIALELGVRFLADYLRGDSYFLLAPDDPPDLNKTRAMVQLTLFERLSEYAPTAKELLARLDSSRPAVVSA